MTPGGFAARLMAVIVGVALVQVVAIESMLSVVTSVSLGQLPLVAYHGAPVVVLFTAIYLALTYMFARPILKFLGDFQKGVEIETARIKKVQDSVINLSTRMVLILYPLYIIGTGFGSWRLSKAPELGWPGNTVYYGLIGGFLSSVLATPMVVYGCNILVHKVLAVTTGLAGAGDKARSAGMKISLRLKMVMPTVTLVAATSGYIALIAYSYEPDPNNLAFLASAWGLSVSISALLALATSRELTRPLNILIKASDRVKDKIFDEPVHLVINDEMAELGVAFNEMLRTIKDQIEEMENIVGALGTGVVYIDETSRMVMEVSSDQAAGATQQATAVQETSSVAEEIVATARQISERALNVDEVATNTKSACEEGEARVSEAEESFKRIEAQVKEIRLAMANLEDRFLEIFKFVERMEEIADQTELLALNASLEAAGAGEEGRRFAVVAESTRRLAVRAAESNREIRELVNAIQEATMHSIYIAEEGEERVAQGAQSFRSTVESLRQISELAKTTSLSVKEISMSTQQQTTASEQLATTVAEVNEVAMRVEEGAKEIEGSMRELREFAEIMRQTVEKHKIGKNEGEHP